MTSKKEQIKQILIVDNLDLRFLSQKKQTQGVISNKITYKDLSRFFTEASSKFLQVELFAKRVTQLLATTESNKDLNNDLFDWK